MSQPPIQRLPDTVIAAVAAGEIIQDASNVVKELIENSLDAGATKISVMVEKGGAEALIVQDNGHGMSADDLRLSWHHHTTSKIRNAEDLLKIGSFGFRGEALSSISAVADVTLRSRPKNSEKGHELILQRQKVVHDQPTGMPQGTHIHVAHLFRDIPARRKSAKSPRTGVKNIQRVITEHALAHPDVRFELHLDGKLSLLFPANATIEQRIATLLGEDSQPYLLPISWEIPHLHIWGYIGKPQLARRQKNHQYVAVNRRPVYHPALEAAVRKAFATLLEPHMHPTFVLFVEVPTDAVDVNMHPQKLEVALTMDTAWIDSFHQSIFNTLQQHDVAYRHGENWSVSDSSPQTTEGSILKHVVDTWQVKPPEEKSEILQAHELYLFFPTARGVLIIDQHAAHERILYEQFTAAWKQQLKEKNLHTLDTPVTIDLSVSDQELLETHLEDLQKIGFILEHFHERKWIISAVPQLYADRDCAILIRQVLDDLTVGPLGKSIHPNQHRLLSYLACRTAIKAGESLTLAERQKLITKLAETNTQYTCPHGRPVMVELSLDELDRLFKRL